MLKVALSGGIASGKTTVSDMFQSLGVPVIDADILSRRAVEPGTDGLNAIRRRFGKDVIESDGTLDRGKLRKIIFSDEQARKDLEAIIHPEVRRLTQEALAFHYTNNEAYCIVVIPLLIETNQHGNYDSVVIVDVSADTQISRVMKRDNSSETQAKKIINSQASRQQRLAVADFVVDNSGPPEALQKQVEKIHSAILQRTSADQ